MKYNYLIEEIDIDGDKNPDGILMTKFKIDKYGDKIFIKSKYISKEKVDKVMSKFSLKKTKGGFNLEKDCFNKNKEIEKLQKEVNQTLCSVRTNEQLDSLKKMKENLIKRLNLQKKTKGGFASFIEDFMGDGDEDDFDFDYRHHKKHHRHQEFSDEFLTPVKRRVNPAKRHYRNEAFSDELFFDEQFSPVKRHHRRHEFRDEFLTPVKKRVNPVRRPSKKPSKNNKKNNLKKNKGGFFEEDFDYRNKRQMPHRNGEFEDNLMFKNKNYHNRNKTQEQLKLLNNKQFNQFMNNHNNPHQPNIYVHHNPSMSNIIIGNIAGGVAGGFFGGLSYSFGESLFGE